MSTPKSIFGTLAAAVLPVMLFSFGLLYSVYQILGSPAPLKEAVSESGLYDTAISEALKNAGASAGSSTTSSLPIDDPGVQKAIEEAISPEYLQQKSEGAIDGLYSWLQGDTEKLQFNLNLEDGKTKLAESLSGYTQQRLASLPVCTEAGDQTAVTNPLNATCVPAGFDSAAAAETVKSEILNNQDFLPDSSLNAQDLTNGQGQTLDQQLSAVPAVYEQVKWGAIITGALALLCIAAILLLSGNLRNGLKRLGWAAVPVGLVSAGLAWGAGLALNKLTDALLDDSGTGGLQARIVDALALLTQDVRNWWLAYGLIIVGAGALAFIVAFVLKKRGGHVTHEPPVAPATPGMAPLNPITNEEARQATEVAPIPAGAPERPARQTRPRPPQKIQ